MIMIIIGCDFHPSWQQVFRVDTETGETGEAKLVHATGEAERGRVDIRIDAFNGRQVSARFYVFFDFGKPSPAGVNTPNLYYQSRGEVSAEGIFQLQFVKDDSDPFHPSDAGPLLKTLNGTFTAANKFTGTLPDCPAPQLVSMQGSTQ